MPDSPFAEKRSGAVSLTFDDGLPSQLEVAVPTLNAHGLRATFYINPRGPDGEWQRRLAPWKSVAEQGHEIGNHSLSHVCSRAYSPTPNARCLETVTLDFIESDVLEAERRLNEVIGPHDRTFAYPCYESFVGEGGARQSYVPVIAKHFDAARATGEFANYPSTCQMHHLWSQGGERRSGEDLIGMASAAAAKGQWLILAFHGINAGHLPVADYDFKAFCDFLTVKCEEIWCAPVVEVAERVVEWRAAAP